MTSQEDVNIIFRTNPEMKQARLVPKIVESAYCDVIASLATRQHDELLGSEQTWSFMCNSVDGERYTKKSAYNYLNVHYSPYYMGVVTISCFSVTAINKTIIVSFLHL